MRPAPCWSRRRRARCSADRRLARAGRARPGIPRLERSTCPRNRTSARGQSPVARVHADGASLALAAPVDQLFTATEVNEWALAATLLARDPARWAGLEAAMIRDAAESATPPAIPPVLDEAAAMTRLKHLSQIGGAPRSARADRRRSRRAICRGSSTTRCSRSARATATSTCRSTRCRPWPTSAGRRLA